MLTNHSVLKLKKNQIIQMQKNIDDKEIHKECASMCAG